MSYVIYAAYGSNLLKERFLVYIKGGTFMGIHYEGCRDKTEPESLGWMWVPYRVYFAKSSGRWNNQGVAFLSCEKEADSEYHAVVRLWKIKESQLEDLQKQEGKGWYGEIITLGEKDGLKILTFTGCWYDEKNMPSQLYLDVLKKGLKETTGWADEEIDKYWEKFLK